MSLTFVIIFIGYCTLAVGFMLYWYFASNERGR